MKRLVHALDMSFSSVVEYYNSFRDKRYDLNCYAITLVEKGIDEYFDWIHRYEKNLYYLVDDENLGYIIGFGSIDNINRYLNEGNIGYGVRPAERKKGYGTLILRLLLEKCKELGMKEVYVSCLEKNTISKKVIENNNGQFEERFFNSFGGNYGLKYRIDLYPRPQYEISEVIKKRKLKRKKLRDFLRFKINC